MNNYHKKYICHIFLVELNIYVPKSGHNNIQVFFCKLFSCGLWKVWKYFFLVLMYLYVDISYLMEWLHDIKSGIYIMCPKQHFIQTHNLRKILMTTSEVLKKETYDERDYFHLVWHSKYERKKEIYCEPFLLSWS